MTSTDRSAGDWEAPVYELELVQRHSAVDLLELRRQLVLREFHIPVRLPHTQHYYLSYQTRQEPEWKR